MTIAFTYWGLHGIDLLMLVIYLLGITVLGVWMARCLKWSTGLLR